MNEQVEFVTMSDREKYLFDLQGFLIVRDFLTPEEIHAFNEVLDANSDKRSEFGPPGPQEKPFSGQFGAYSFWIDMIAWEQPWCQPFRNLIAHRKLIPYLNTMMGRGWKIDHGVEVLTMKEGCEGLTLHGHGNVDFNGSRHYVYQNGRMRCGLIVCQFYLTDVNDGDGGLCLVPGSHKANFPFPMDRGPRNLEEWEIYKDVVYQPILKAGDLIIFNEATTHGGLPWRGKTERRCVLHRYTPKYLHYASGYYETSQPEWVSELTEAQQAVLEPPYMYNRALIEEDGITIVRPRREGE